ncbi:MAG: PorV/PorQ family protein, partial [Candidatus Neomarinimicrobiota bacterium]
MKKVFNLLLAGILIMTLSFSAYAQIGLKKVAQSTMNFLLVSISPHASGMGEAYCAVGTGVESILYNPAGISETANRFEMQTYSTQWIGDINYLGGSFIWNLRQYGTLGLSLLSVDYGTIYGTGLLLNTEKDQYLQGYIDLGKIDNVGAFACGLTYGRAISTQFLIGGDVRIVGQNLGQTQLDNGLKNNNAVKAVFDAGVKYNTGFHGFRFGMSIRNFSSNIKREELEEQLPLLFTMGMAIDL